MLSRELRYEDRSPVPLLALSEISRVEEEIDSLLEIGEGLLD